MLRCATCVQANRLYDEIKRQTQETKDLADAVRESGLAQVAASEESARAAAEIQALTVAHRNYEHDLLWLERCNGQEKIDFILPKIQVKSLLGQNLAGDIDAEDVYRRGYTEAYAALARVKTTLASETAKQTTFQKQASEAAENIRNLRELAEFSGHSAYRVSWSAEALLKRISEPLVRKGFVDLNVAAILSMVEYISILCILPAWYISSGSSGRLATQCIALLPAIIVLVAWGSRANIVGAMPFLAFAPARLQLGLIAEQALGDRNFVPLSDESPGYIFTHCGLVGAVSCLLSFPFILLETNEGFRRYIKRIDLESRLMASFRARSEAQDQAQRDVKETLISLVAQHETVQGAMVACKMAEETYISSAVALVDAILLNPHHLANASRVIENALALSFQVYPPSCRPSITDLSNYTKSRLPSIIRTHAKDDPDFLLGIAGSAGGTTAEHTQ
jgi:hypothetical protein